MHAIDIVDWLPILNHHINEILEEYKNNDQSKEAKIRNRFNQIPHLTQDTTWESDKNTMKHNIRESQEASPFSAGDHKAAMYRQESMTNT